MKLFVVAFENIVQDRLYDIPIPRDWLLTSAYGEIEAFAETLPMGSSCICRKDCDYTSTEHAIHPQLRRDMYDTSVYEECRVLITFPDGARPVADLLYTLEVLAYTSAWGEVILQDTTCPARHFVSARATYMRSLLCAPLSSFGAYWRTEREKFMSKLKLKL